MICRLLFAFAAVCMAVWSSDSSRAAGNAGQFDFYVLSLSWSPSHCEAQGDQRHDAQCTRPFGFVVHGLWPQYEKGYPSDCPDTAGRLPTDLIKAQLDIFPAFGLVIHEWRKHGTCSGLDPQAYFKAAHQAFGAVVLPSDYVHLDKPQMVEPEAVEKAFIAANKGLGADAIAVSCDSRRLTEVRICFSKDLSGFRPCPEVNGQSCKLQKAYLPAVRPGH